MGKNAPSLRDVAQAAGVSLGTASRALNNKSHVLPTTRSQVLKAAADLGYRQQLRIPTTTAPRIRTIGVVVKRDPAMCSGAENAMLTRIDMFNYAVLRGVEMECAHFGINMMYASLEVNNYSEATAWTPLLENEDIGGLIIIGVIVRDPKVADRIPAQIPVVMVDADCEAIECDAVLTDNVRAAERAVSYLVESGHRNIGLIGSTLEDCEHRSIRERRVGYFNVLAARRLPIHYAETSFLYSESAYGATRRLLERAPEVTAVFACNDDVGKAVIRAAKDMGRRVPAELSIVGFDDTVEAATLVPPLTTVRVAKELMGSLAVRQLMERPVQSERPPITSIIGTRLIIRASVTRAEFPT